MNRPYCEAGGQSGAIRAIEKPPVFGYNYDSITLTEPAVVNPGVAYPQGVTRPLGIFSPKQPIVIVGLWLASSIVNPAGVDSGVFVGKLRGQPDANNDLQISLSNAPSMYFQHISRSVNTISRTGGLAFGEQSGLYIGSGEQFGVYLSGSDAGLEITYALTVTYITSFKY